MRASVNEKKTCVSTGVLRGSFCKNSFSRKEPSPKDFICFSLISSELAMVFDFLNSSSWSSWNILAFVEGFRCTLIISRTPSETFEKVKRSVERVLISWYTRIASRSHWITWSEKCIAQTKTCLNSWASLQFRNLSKVFLCCSSSGNWKNVLSRVRHGLWSIRERCICWLFSCHIPFSINNYLFPFHLEKNLNFQRYNFLIGILDVCRIPRIYLNEKINFITSLRLLFYSESMRESSPYLKYSMLVYTIILILTFHGLAVL